MSRIIQNKNFLNLLCQNINKKKYLNSLIKNATKNQIYYICEIVLNLLKGNIPL